MILTGVAMLAYVVFGGMLATTWVQIVKAVMLLAVGAAMSVAVLWQFHFNVVDLFDTAAARHPLGDKYLGPGGSNPNPLNTLSAGVAYAIGTAALPHILIRFFTVPDAQAARRSVGWAVGLIGTFFVMTSIIGYGARALLPSGSEEATAGGNLTAPLFAQHLGGGEGTFGGDVFIAFVSAVAFATILAVVAGLLLSASGAISHDLWFNVLKPDASAAEREGTAVARVAALAVGVVAIVLTIALGDSLNVALLVGLALSIAASANFPALVLCLAWRRFNTVGALVGIFGGLIASVTLIILGPQVWPGGPEAAPFPLTFPVLVSIPVGFAVLLPGHAAESAKRGGRADLLRAPGAFADRHRGRGAHRTLNPETPAVPPGSGRPLGCGEAERAVGSPGLACPRRSGPPDPVRAHSCDWTTSSPKGPRRSSGMRTVDLLARST